ncbi:hypothetical protein ACF2JD_10145 [Aeromonas sp. A-5]|uniref:hypothetical protein n=1 Tax=Aeromonas ichthyocola TaxID=3367746 RepID=UPI0038EDE606
MAICITGDLSGLTRLAGEDPAQGAIPIAQLLLTDAENWYSALESGKGNAYLGDYLQLRYLMREFPADGLRCAVCAAMSGWSAIG